MAVQKLTIQKPKSVKKLTMTPIKRVNRFDEASRVREAKTFRMPIGDDMIELSIGSLTIQIRPVSAMEAQIHYAPDGPMFEDEIHAWLWKAQKDFRLWDQKFTGQIMAEWKRITKEII